MLEQMLIPKESIAVQKIVLKTLSTIQGEEFPLFVIGKWNSFLPNLRDEGIRLLLSNEKGTIELIKALEAGTVDPSAIPWPRQVGMMAQADDNLRLRSREIFSNKVNDVKKKKVLEQYSDISSLKGDVDKGLEVFKINCATCHQIGGEYGTAYGPDLASIRSRKPESIVKDILDPGLSIADGYDLWEVKLINGETKQGIISSETSNSINLRVLGSSDEVLSRSDIEGLTAKNISVMPAGLESQISINDMADLLAFIKKLKK
ncbi:c-type cytochrome [Membranihabitans marinus]|uniref:c-type cytochrome n=1 Tax=Membranihabitans marinus TaxID=1227546 RepID=UPI001EFFE0CF|nr:c-type cytochrome [Membranihabitans marinus]